MRTTITNSGGELKQPHKNVGRAIIIAIGLCLGLYLLVAFAVGDIGAKAWVLVVAFVLDAVILGALLYVKAKSDPVVLYASVAGIALVFAGEKWFMHTKRD